MHDIDANDLEYIHVEYQILFNMSSWKQEEKHWSNGPELHEVEYVPWATNTFLLRISLAEWRVCWHMTFITYAKACSSRKEANSCRQSCLRKPKSRSDNTRLVCAWHTIVIYRAKSGNRAIVWIIQSNMYTSVRGSRIRHHFLARHHLLPPKHPWGQQCQLICYGRSSWASKQLKQPDFSEIVGRCRLTLS
jgi:hypothetical protein